jgi:choline dehydrogenase
LHETYDFIVCGGGTSGCVVASRLSENPNVKVLLLEAGGSDEVDAVSDSRVWMSNIGSERDWGFRAESSPTLNGRCPQLPMGKVLGGGSSINGLIWARGHKNDFDMWARETGDPGWSYASVLEVYKRIENWSGVPDPARRGHGGPVHVSVPANPVPVATALTEAAAAWGIPVVADLNGAAMEGPGACGIPNVTIEGSHRRVSMATAYVRPALGRSNLTIMTDAQVYRLRFSGQRVTGVDYLLHGRPAFAQASCEIVLSAGAINTPKILMYSGVGDAVELKRHGIPLIQHLPGVGQNFQDHILVAGCVWEYQTPEPPRNNSAEFTFFWKSRPDLPTPDLQPVLEECAFGSERTGPEYGLPADRAAAWTLAPGLVRPESRGHLALTGNRPQDRLAIHANFLSDRRDVDALLRAVELCREIGNGGPLAPYRKRELMPGPLKGAQLEQWLRNAAGTYFHQTCTAKMGRDAMSVVDGCLKVYGVKGLRIADGSVMPAITTGNTMAPCVMIGERAAELIMRDFGLFLGE